MIRVEKIIPGGQALSTLPDGRKIFLWNALPGEEIAKYEITKQKSHYVEAIATNIKYPSPHRIMPRDDCYLSTSPWQMMDYGYELKQKQLLVDEIFREHHIAVSASSVYTDGQPYFYRNKMEYSLYYDHNLRAISLAFHERGSHRKVSIRQSSLERPEIFTKATEIVNELNRNGDEARKYQSLLLRCNQSGEVSGGLFVKNQPHPAFKSLNDTLLGYTYSYSPNGFFQINLPVYELALKEIKKHITTKKVLDLYAGVGTIGLSVARDHHLVLVESDKSAYNELCENCKDKNSPQTIHEILAKSEEALSYIEPDGTVILDPPRAGCDEKLIGKLLEITPAKIIYLSCNPATQARDVKLLLEKYQILDVQTFNFFPRTPHIENLVILSPKSL